VTAKDETRANRYDTLTRQIATYRRALERVTAARDALDATSGFPAEDPCVDGDVISFNKRYDGSPQVYTYVAVRRAGRWFVTGGPSFNITWEQLVKFMTSRGTVKKIWKLRRGERIM